VTIVPIVTVILSNRPIAESRKGRYTEDMESTRSHGRSFPLARRMLALTGKTYASWRVRHQHPFNFAIHLVGIPLAVVGLLVLVFEDWQWGLAGLVGGYLFQFVGHRVEGNDVGEWAGIKRLFGLPFVGVAPRYLGTGTPITESHVVTLEPWADRVKNPRNPDDPQNFSHPDSRYNP
jgi:hypothetical protein